MQSVRQRLGVVVAALASLLLVLPQAHGEPARAFGASAISLANAGDARLAAATFLGGEGVDYGRTVALDAQNNIYVAGDTFSSSLVDMNLVDRGGQDIVVTKLSPDAKQVLGIFSIGSTTTDRVGGMAVTPQGEVVLLVETSSANFPVKNALHTTPTASNPGVLLKIDAALNTVVFSTFTTFTVEYNLHNVTVDGAGGITVAGYRYTPFYRARDMVVQKFSPDGQTMRFEKVWDNDPLDERPQAIVTKPDGTTFIAGYTEGRTSTFPVTDNAVQKVCGRKQALGQDRDCDVDAFVMTLDPTGAITYASYLGGVGIDKGSSLAVDPQGAIYLFGSTTAADFPTTADAVEPACPRAEPTAGCYYDTFVAKVSPDGSTLVYSTYLGSDDLSGLEYPAGITVDAQGNATVVGWTASQHFPTKNAIQSALNAAPCPNAFQDRLCFDSFVTTFDPGGQFIFSSYLGGAFDEITTGVASGPDGSVYLTGYTESFDYPVTAGAVQPTQASGTDFFLARINLQAPVVAVPDPTPNPTPNPAPTPAPGQEKVYLPLVSR
jgi:hypothetical protein